jgi:hypothetical protein
MLRLLPSGKWRRKRLLLVCAAWRLVWASLPEGRSLQAIEALEHLAEEDDIAQQHEAECMAMQIEEPYWSLVWEESGQFQPRWAPQTAALAATMLFSTAALDRGDAYLAAEAEAERVLDKVRQDGEATLDAWNRQLALLAACVRDIIPNPIRRSPLLPPTVLAWNDGAVVRIARGILEERAFDRLPILADALLDAGCNDEVLIAHCHSHGPHHLGCWALDQILGLE